MKKLFFAAIIFVSFSTVTFCQSASVQKLLQNDLRYWFPVGVKMDVITQNLTEGKKVFDISEKKMSMKSPNSATFLVDRVITVQLSKNPDVGFPAVLYMIYEGTCTGMVYLDLFENLPKWEDQLKKSVTMADNYFVANNLIHYLFRLSPQDGIISIQIDVTY